MVVEDDVAHIDDNAGGKFRFDDDFMTGVASSSGAARIVEDTMMGMFTEMNIVGITEVFSPPRVVMQGLKI